MIKQAMILAAGKGERMRPLTDVLPKPMLPVRGKPIIDYALQTLADEGMNRVIVNTHYCAHVLHDHLNTSSWPFEIVISHEDKLLDTGGGIKNALKHCDKNAPLMVLSGDSILLGKPNLAARWDGNAMDLLLLLQPLDKMILTPGVGDYDIVNDKPVRRPDQSGRYIWTSARILHPRLFDGAQDGPFSFLELMDKAERENRLGACIHDGVWHHLTTPGDIESVEEGG